jgi:hypothetical protein
MPSLPLVATRRLSALLIRRRRQQKQLWRLTKTASNEVTARVHGVGQPLTRPSLLIGFATCASWLVLRRQCPSPSRQRWQEIQTAMLFKSGAIVTWPPLRLEPGTPSPPSANPRIEEAAPVGGLSYYSR